MTLLKKSKSLFILALLSILFSSALQAQQRQDALQLYRDGNFQEAILVCEREIEEKPNNMDSYAVLCWSLVRNKQYSEAELWANKALKIAPYDQRIIEILAEAQYFLGKNAESLYLFQEYISLVPSNGSRVGDAYFYMAEIFVRQGKFNHADIAFSQAVQIEPLKDYWWTRLGYTRETTKNYKLSAQAYEKAIELNSKNTDAVKGKQRVMEHIR